MQGKRSVLDQKPQVKARGCTYTSMQKPVLIKPAKKFIVFGKPSIGKEEIKAVTEVLKSGWIGTGPKVKEFEIEFAKYVGAKHAVAVSHCTGGLHIALEAVGVGPGDEVIAPSLTFAATINAIEYARATPVLVDVDPKTHNIDPKAIERAITKRTKAIMPVHFGGLACDMKAIFALAKKHNLFVVEDAAHAMGTVYGGTRIGGFKNSLAVFSFYPNKNLTSIEGGMITTNSPELARKLEILSLHGMDNEAWKRYKSGTKLILYEVVSRGYKYNMTDVQAAVGLVQLKKFETMQKKREEYAKIYEKYFSNLKGISLQEKSKNDPKNKHALHLYTLVMDLPKFKIDRNEMVSLIKSYNIGAAIHYKGVHLHTHFKQTLKHDPAKLPHTTRISESIFSLPLTPVMTEAEAHYVGQTVRSLIEANYV